MSHLSLFGKILHNFQYFGRIDGSIKEKQETEMWNAPETIVNNTSSVGIQFIDNKFVIFSEGKENNPILNWKQVE